MPRFPQVIYFPDRFLVVVLSAILACSLDWEDRGLELLGHTEISSSQLFAFQWPFRLVSYEVHPHSHEQGLHHYPLGLL